MAKGNPLMETWNGKGRIEERGDPGKTGDPRSSSLGAGPGSRERLSALGLWICGSLLGCRALEGVTSPTSGATDPTPAAQVAEPTEATQLPRETGPELETPSTSTEDLVAASLESPTNSRRRELSRSLSQEPGWNLYETPHYFVATPLNDPALVEGIKSRLEACYARLHNQFPPRVELGERRAPLVRVHPSREAFHAAGGQMGTTCFWSRNDRSLVLFDAASPQDRAQVTWPALQHIVVHEYFDSALALDPVQPWLLYGVAAQFESLTFSRSSGGLDLLSFPADSGRWQELSQQTAGAAPPPLARLLGFNLDEFQGRNEFGSGGYRNLILAWSFLRYLDSQEASPQHGFLERYLSAPTSLGAGSRALDQALDGGSLEALDAGWRLWIEARIGRGLEDE